MHTNVMTAAQTAGLRKVASTPAHFYVVWSPRVTVSSTLNGKCLFSTPAHCNRFRQGRLRLSRFLTKLCLGIRLCLFSGRWMGSILTMAVSRSFTSSSLSLLVCMLSYRLPLPLHLI